MTEVHLKMDGLKGILKAFGGKKPVARIGILGTTARKDQTGTTNATIGAAHEFGTSTIPMRSFLRIPIAENLGLNLQNAGAFTEDVLSHVIAQGTMTPWVEKIAIESVGIVMDAFDTSGFGKWAPLSPETMDRKKVKQILVETQQLRNSITYDVKEGG